MKINTRPFLLCSSVMMMLHTYQILKVFHFVLHFDEVSKIMSGSQTSINAWVKPLSYCTVYDAWFKLNFKYVSLCIILKDTKVCLEVRLFWWLNTIFMSCSYRIVKMLHTNWILNEYYFEEGSKIISQTCFHACVKYHSYSLFWYFIQTE